MTISIPIAKFKLGQIVSTPRVIVQVPAEDLLLAIRRHQSGDWGEVSKEDWETNNISLERGMRILSAYRTRKGLLFWIITEADRSSTCILLPEEY